MQDLFKFTIDTIRRDPEMGWLEDRRDEWTPLLASKLKLFLSGRPFILFCDNERIWFEKYFIHKINSPINSRPLLPFFSLSGLYLGARDITNKEEIAYIDDLLSITFPNGFIYFYIGKGFNALSSVAKRKDDSYMWLIGEHAQNSFYIDQNDAEIDVKLIKLFTLFDKSIDAALFSEVIL